MLVKKPNVRVYFSDKEISKEQQISELAKFYAILFSGISEKQIKNAKEALC